MKRVAKVAVSIPVDTLKSLERMRVRLRKTRSAAVTQAIEKWLRAEEVGKDDQRYVEGYLRYPEQGVEAAAIASVVVATWDRWE
jgi:metal-responsive CopG/Arc/MetJ family transcriptional regulator